MFIHSEKNSLGRRLNWGCRGGQFRRLGLQAVFLVHKNLSKHQLALIALES
jgi:hypothetical protein